MSIIGQYVHNRSFGISYCICDENESTNSTGNLNYALELEYVITIRKRQVHMQRYQENYSLNISLFFTARARIFNGSIYVLKCSMNSISESYVNCIVDLRFSICTECTVLIKEYSYAFKLRYSRSTDQPQAWPIIS